MTTRQRTTLSALVPKLAHDIRNLTFPQLVFLQTFHDLETLRIQADRPSVQLRYFSNASINDSVLLRPMEIIADQVRYLFYQNFGCLKTDLMEFMTFEQLLRIFLNRMSATVLEHSMQASVVSEEVRKFMIAATHRYRQVRKVALKHLDAILTSFAALMCDGKIVFVLLEILTLLRRSCEDTLTDEVS